MPRGGLAWRLHYRPGSGSNPLMDNFRASWPGKLEERPYFCGVTWCL